MFAKYSYRFESPEPRPNRKINSCASFHSFPKLIDPQVIAGVFARWLVDAKWLSNA